MRSHRISEKLIARMFKATKLNDGALANKLGVRRETINRWKNGTQRPGNRAYYKLANLHENYLKKRGLFSGRK